MMLQLCNPPPLLSSSPVADEAEAVMATVAPSFVAVSLVTTAIGGIKQMEDSN